MSSDLPLGLFGILIVLLALSAFFSSSETAFSSVNKIRLKNYVDEKRKGSKKALFIAENFDKALSTILVGNNIVNIAAATISAKIAVDLLGEGTGLLVNTIVMTILVLIFGEILPKSLAKENAERFSLSISGILFLLMKLLSPVTFFFIKLKDWSSKLVKNSDDHPSVTEEEIKVMVDLSEEEGVIDQREKELVHRSLEFNDILVGEILKPRIDIVAVDVNQSIDEIKDLFLEERYSRIPVYDGYIDNIIGILSERDFLGCIVRQETIEIRELLWDPLFVVESTKISVLLPELQKNKVHMAIVIDEFGGTSGLVTMEDILEELVGEIWDEHEEKVKAFTKVDQDTYIFNADLSLDEFVRFTNIEHPGNMYKSLGGWIVHGFERLPSEGEVLHFENVEIKINNIENRRIRTVQVKVLEREEEEADF